MNRYKRYKKKQIFILTALFLIVGVIGMRVEVNTTDHSCAKPISQEESLNDDGSLLPELNDTVLLIKTAIIARLWL